MMKVQQQPVARACAPLLETPCPALTDDEFMVFHSLDRELYGRLALSLRREPAVSMKVIAFWMWLERESHDTRLIRRILFLPPEELNKLADETMTCLDCVEDIGSNSLLGDHDHEISLLPNLLNYWFRLLFSLRSLHERRVGVLRGVHCILNTVCVRAFKDIMHKLVFHQNPATHAPAATGGGTSLKEHTPDIQAGSRTQPLLS